jgi:hypothetical protein
VVQQGEFLFHQVNTLGKHFACRASNRGSVCEICPFKFSADFGESHAFVAHNTHAQKVWPRFLDAAKHFESLPLLTFRFLRDFGLQRGIRPSRD